MLEQFVRNLEVNNQKWVKWHQPWSLAEALSAVEDHTNTEFDHKPAKKERIENTGPPARAENRTKGWWNEGGRLSVKEMRS